MPKHQFHKGDFVAIGEPPNTETYVITTEPDAGRYCEVRKFRDYETATVYLGRWAQPLLSCSCLGSASCGDANMRRNCPVHGGE